MKISMRKFINYIALKQVTHTVLKQVLVRVSPSLAYYELFKDVLYLFIDVLIAQYTLDDTSNDRMNEESQPQESLSNSQTIIYDERKPHSS